MAVTINTGGTYSVTRVDSADSATGWATVKHEGAGGTPALLASVGTIDLVAEGTDARAARTNKQRVEIEFSHAAGYDFTSDSSGTGATAIPSGNVYIWAAFLAAGSALTKANGGLQIVLGDGSGKSCWNVAGSDTYSGGLVKWAASTTIAESENIGGAATLGDIVDIGFITDVAGTTTRFDNFVVDAIDVGDGLTFQGTTTTDKLFSESATVDAATAIGVLSEIEEIFFSQGSLEFSGTAQTSIGETLVFSDTLGGVYTYDFAVTGTQTFTNSSVSAAGAVDYDFDSSTATAFTMNGGGFTNYKTLTTGAGQTIDGIVLAAGGTASIANTISNSTANQCGKFTVTGSLDSCTINQSTATEAASAATTAKADGCTFIKDTGTSHAFELTGTANTYTWNSTATGYDAGSVGAGVEVTGGSITGDETIHITAASGNFVIQVASGATVPSVSTAGATVEVQSGGVSIDVNVKNESQVAVAGALVYIDEDLGVGGNITNTTTDVSGDITQASYTGAATSATLRVRLYGYKPYLATITLTQDSATNVTLINDPQQT